jgi:hypothetical protein
VNSTGRLIIDMVDKSREVSLSTIKKHCQRVNEWAESLGYETDSRRGLTLENDGMVTYHKSFYNGKPCYYIKWSAIEYIWIKQKT